MRKEDICFLNQEDPSSARTYNKPSRNLFEHLEAYNSLLLKSREFIQFDSQANDQKYNGYVDNFLEEFGANGTGYRLYDFYGDRYLRIPTGAFCYDSNKIVINKINLEIFERQLGDMFGFDLHERGNDIQVDIETKYLNGNYNYSYNFTFSYIDSNYRQVTDTTNNKLTNMQTVIERLATYFYVATPLDFRTKLTPTAEELVYFPAEYNKTYYVYYNKNENFTNETLDVMRTNGIYPSSTGRFFVSETNDFGVKTPDGTNTTISSLKIGEITTKSNSDTALAFQRSCLPQLPSVICCEPNAVTNFLNI